MLKSLLRYFAIDKKPSHFEKFEPIYGLTKQSLKEWLSRNPKLEKEYNAKLKGRGREMRNYSPRRIAMVDATRSHDHAPAISDEIATAAAHLARHLRGRLSDISLSMQRGGVVIAGRTRSYYVKQLAQHAVMERVSLPIVANEIEVRGV